MDIKEKVDLANKTVNELIGADCNGELEFMADRGQPGTLICWIPMAVNIDVHSNELTPDNAETMIRIKLINGLLDIKERCEEKIADIKQKG
jgi:hypothetical protein